MTTIKLRDPDPRPHYFPAGGPWDRIQTMSLDDYLRKVRPHFKPAGHPAVRPVVSCRPDFGLLSAPAGFKPLEPEETPRILDTLRGLLALRPPFPE